MKKNFTRTAFVAVFALMTGYSVYASQQEKTMSDLALANVEALAGNEWEGDNECHMDTTFWECLKYTQGLLLWIVEQFI